MYLIMQCVCILCVCICVSVSVHVLVCVLQGHRNQSGHGGGGGGAKVIIKISFYILFAMKPQAMMLMMLTINFLVYQATKVYSMSFNAIID